MSEEWWLGWIAPGGRTGHLDTSYPGEFFAQAAKEMFSKSRDKTWVVIGPEQIAAWKEEEKMQEVARETEPKIRNQAGQMVPESLVPGRMRLEEQTVRTLIAKARAMQAALIGFKAAAFEDVAAFRELLAAQYAVDVSGRRGGGVLTSYDGCAKVEISHADTITLGPEMEAAKALIDECIQDWSASGGAELRTLVNGAFKVGEGGKIRVDRVLELRNLEINDSRWMRAMVAISDAVRVTSSKSYIRFHERDTPEGEWKQVVLNMSSL